MRLAETRSDVAGLSLQRPTLNASSGEQLARIGPENAPFLYGLVGSIGFAPRPEVWRDFLAWHGKSQLSEDPTAGAVSGLVTSKWYAELARDGRAQSMWTQWFIKFSADRGLYTLYQNPLGRGALASHSRAKGEHSAGDAGKDFPACSAEDVALDGFDSLALPQYDFSARARTPGEGRRPSVGFVRVDSARSEDTLRSSPVDSAPNAGLLRTTATMPGSRIGTSNGGFEDARVEQFLGPQAAEAVSSALERLRKSASRAVIAAFTVEMRGMAENFLCSAAAAQGRNAGILMVGLYEGACEDFPSHGAECVAIAPKGIPANSIMDVVYKSEKYLHSVLMKQIVFSLAVSSRDFEWLLLSDVDVAFLEPPFAYIDDEGLRGDFAFMRGDAELSSTSMLNSGFYYVRPTRGSREIMWKALDNVFRGRTYDGTDQGALAQAIEDAGVTPTYLPSSLYPNGAILVRHPESLAPAPRAFHLNYVKTMSEKIRCMKSAHCWSVKSDGTCLATCSPQQIRNFDCSLEGALLF
jgi:hypothetical protein